MSSQQQMYDKLRAANYDFDKRTYWNLTNANAESDQAFKKPDINSSSGGPCSSSGMGLGMDYGNDNDYDYDYGNNDDD